MGAGVQRPHLQAGRSATPKGVERRGLPNTVIYKFGGVHVGASSEHAENRKNWEGTDQASVASRETAAANTCAATPQFEPSIAEQTNARPVTCPPPACLLNCAAFDVGWRQLAPLDDAPPPQLSDCLPQECRGLVALNAVDLDPARARDARRQQRMHQRPASRQRTLYEVGVGRARGAAAPDGATTSGDTTSSVHA